MADITNKREWEEYINSVPEMFRKQVEDSLTDSQKQQLGLTTTASGEFDDVAPGDVAAAPLDPGNQAWNSEADILAARQATAAKEDPLGALLQQSAEQNQWEREKYEEHQDKLNMIAGVGGSQLSQAGTAADTANLAVLDSLNTKMDPLLQEVEAGGFVGPASADQGAIAAQYGALDEYGRRAQGGFTGVEKAQAEINRRMQERDLRSQREAHMRQLQMRGAKSSGMEVAQMLGAQQGTAENRLMRDMQNEANAQQRADRALDAGAGLASGIRGSSFGESSFNKSLQQQDNQFRARHQSQERQRIAAGNMDLANTAFGVVDKGYQHQTQPTYFAAQTLTGNAPTQPTGATSQDANKTALGIEQADKAADLLDDDNGLFGLGISL